MEERIKELLNKIALLEFENLYRLQVEYLCEEAKSVLIDSLKEKTLGIYKTSLIWNNDLKEAIKSGDKVKFIHESYFNVDARNFLKDNFSNIELIIETLQEHLKGGEING